MVRQKNRAEVDPRVTKHKTFEYEGRLYSHGDPITVQYPWNEKGTSVYFNYYVVPDNGVPYVEVKEGSAKDGGMTLCIRPETITKGGRKI